MINLFPQAHSATRRLAQLPREMEKALVNQGRILTQLNRQLESTDLCDYEFRIFSQWGEDGIIQYLTRSIPEISRTFIEFGVEDFSESNCRFLMLKDNWSGYVIDGSHDHIRAIQAKDYYWKHDLTAVEAFIDKDNINGLLENSRFGTEPGILSVDIDGVDFFVLDALSDWRPSIVIVEYNGLFGFKDPVSVPYSPAFSRFEAHYSGLYWGASLTAFHELLRDRGYALVGTNRVGSNAFFVRRDHLGQKLQERLPKEAWRPVSFRDCRGQDGQLHFPSQEERLQIIAQLPLVNTITGETLHVRDLCNGTCGLP